MEKGYQKKLDIERYFIEEGKSPESYFEWERGDINISDDSGKDSFIQKNVEFPKQWGPLARKIVGSKYFFGENGTSQRESSLKDLVGRVSETMSEWGVKQEYFSKEDAKVFSDELAYFAYSQKMAFNSPVWFNVGLHKRDKGSNEKKEAYIMNNKGKAVSLPIGKDRIYPQTSACFIQHVDDSMEGIMDLAKNEALLFKYGSGTGTNLSTLRSSKEKLSGGGKPSGPLAYWAFYDKVAGIVKSGGKTRRAAKMDILNISHPDIKEFIESKINEEKKLHILIDNGISWTEAQESVNYQNTNISVRVTDDFMQAVEEDKEWKTIPVHNKKLADEMPKYKASDLFKKIAEGTHFCGDPGVQFHDTINKWHTCPNSGEIEASNPCTEYMHVNDSSCNLASLNLMKFFNMGDSFKSAKFESEEFKHVVRLTAIAQDLEFDNSSFPTKKIAENSHKFRPLGMGYANLGSLVMSLGLPYDSEGARAVASSITSLMTGTVYETSTEMAEKIGTFEEFEKNKEPMLKVMKMHKDALDKIDKTKIPNGLENILEEAEKTWDNVIKRGEKYGFRNAQATVLAPTGTIGFMMDCDTKGIEPEIGLIQTKLLSDGGILRLVNNNVRPTLEKLGYDSRKIEQIVDYIEKEETIENAPNIKEEHLPIFDCANKPKQGKRTISSYGHLKMMSAVQPFLSGAISKTVNLPEEANVEEIEQVYKDAWKMGLKAVALYRDNSKRIQPLNFKKKNLEEVAKPVRRKLPVTADSKRHKFNIVGHEGYLHVGLYEDKTPGETFMDMHKEGSTIKGLINALAISTSLNLQYGVPLEDLVKKFRHQKFEPRGLVLEGHPEIKTADSIVDYIFHFLEKQFLDNGNDEGYEHLDNGDELKIENSFINSKKDPNDIEEKGGFCAQCGTQMIKKGHCVETCPKCGWEDARGCGG